MARPNAPIADVPATGERRRAIPTRWLLLVISFALFVVGVAYGDPTGPQGEAPPFGVSPIVRRRFNDVQQQPRVDAAIQNLPQPKARGELQELLLDSAVLGRETTLGIYLPPDYGDSDRRYPVLYALHGLAGYYAEWADFGAIEVADRLFSNSMVPPFILVFPQGDQGYWFNHPQGGDAWADFVTDEVVPLVDQQYRTIPSQSARAIGGLSMGGTGALQIGLRRPDLFSVVGAHSPSFRNEPDDEGVFWFFANPGWYAQYDPFALVRTSNSAYQLRIWIDVGNSDPWRSQVEQFHQLLLERGIAHRWIVGKGIHEGTYWGPNMPEYLSFYGYVLLPPAPAPPS